MLFGSAFSSGKSKGIAGKLDDELLADFEEEQAQLVEEKYQKARNDYLYIEEKRHALKDRGLAGQFERLQHISGNMLKYLQKNPRKILQAQKFVDYYQDRAVMFIDKYRELEETNLETSEFAAMKDRLRRSLGDVEAAYNDQFRKLLQDQFSDIQAEMEVIHRSLDMDGISRGSKYTAVADPVPITVEATSPNDFPVADLPDIQPLQQKRRNRREQNTAFPVNSGIIPDELRKDVILTKLIQSALAIFLGGFGAHKFYQGKTWQGIIYCLLFWTGLPEFIGFCEGIRYLVMKLDDFYLNYYLERNK